MTVMKEQSCLSHDKKMAVALGYRFNPDELKICKLAVSGDAASLHTAQGAICPSCYRRIAGTWGLPVDSEWVHAIP